MRAPTARTWEILAEADREGRAAGTTAAVVLAMAIELMEARMPEFRRQDPRVASMSGRVPRDD